MLNPLSTSLNPLSSDSELSGFKIRNTLTFYLGGTQWSPRFKCDRYNGAQLCEFEGLRYSESCNNLAKGANDASSFSVILHN